VKSLTPCPLSQGEGKKVILNIAKIIQLFSHE